MDRRRTEPQGFDAAAAILVAVVLVLLGGLGLAGAWYFVKHSRMEKTEPPPSDEVGIEIEDREIPFDQPIVDESTGEWLMELEAVGASPATLEALKVRARACQDFLRDGSFHRLYPEASKKVRLRVSCFNWPFGRARDDLEGWLEALEGLDAEVRYEK